MGSLSQTQVESLHWFVIGALCRVIRCSFTCPQEKSHNNTHIELIIRWKNQPSNRKVVKGKEFQKKKMNANGLSGAPIPVNEMCYVL